MIFGVTRLLQRGPGGRPELSALHERHFSEFYPRPKVRFPLPDLLRQSNVDALVGNEDTNGAERLVGLPIFRPLISRERGEISVARIESRLV